MTSDEQALLQSVADMKDEQIASTRDLVAIPTVNPYSGDDSAGSEAAGQDWIEQEMRQMQGDVRRIDVPDNVYELGRIIGPSDRSWSDRQNVVGEWTLGSGDGKCIVLNNHMDTVGTDGMEFDPFDPVMKDGLMYGRGSSDTKGNMVMGLVAVKAILANSSGLDGRIIFESVVDEECNGAGAGTLACCFEGITGDIAICLDGSTGGLVNGCMGIATSRVLVSGKGGHSSTGGSVSAIDKAIAVKEQIDVFRDEHVEAHPSCVINIGMFHSGTLPAIVPGEAELQLNMSYDTQDAELSEEAFGVWDGAVFRQRFQDAMAGMGHLDEWFNRKPVRVEWIKDMYPFISDANDPLIQIVANAASEVREEEVCVKPMTAWFDGAHLARRLGIPCVGAGRGTPGKPHSADEYVVIDDLLKGAQSLALALYRLLQ